MTITETPMVEILDSYNRYADELGESTVNRFASRAVALKRHEAIVERYKAANPPVQPVAEPEVKAKKAKPAPKAATGIINKAGRIVLKQNKEVRAALKAAAKLAGGTRLIPSPVAFKDFTHFLAGFDAVPGKTTTVDFVVAGVEGSSVKLVVAKDGSWVVN